MFGPAADQSGVKAVAVAYNAALRQPGFEFAEHLSGQVDVAWAILETQTHVYWQTVRTAWLCAAR